MAWALGRDGTHEVVSEVDRRGNPLRTVVCMETGLVRNDPVPGDEELAKFYAEDYRKDYKGAEKPRKRQIIRNFRRAAEHIRQFRDVLEPGQHVLDVGAGSGEFAYLMTRLGKDVIGIDPTPSEPIRSIL
jgi:2-polyprenyl-3-methyl-5-hydroxy-6-metoxy-1,4-benzoquinol methylase